MRSRKVKDGEILLSNSVTFKEEKQYYAGFFSRDESKEFKKSFLFVCFVVFFPFIFISWRLITLQY